MLTFNEVLSFILGIIGFWAHYIKAILLNGPVIAVQMQMLNLFFFFDMESLKNCTAVIVLILSLKPWTS